MDSSLTGLIRFYERARADGRDLVLATILRTEASTYRKAGARILIDVDGESSSLLSGGCLEADLRERAQRVLARGQAQRVWFDTRVSDDLLWGLGMGCQGAMDVWLEPARPANDYGPLPFLSLCLASRRQACLATVVGGAATEQEFGAHSAQTQNPPGDLDRTLRALACTAPELRTVRFAGRDLEVFIAPVQLPIRLLLCGAGPDAIPLHTFARNLGWAVSIYDHRPAYASIEHFPGAERIYLQRPEELAEHVQLEGFDAAMIMSHHLNADIAYLRALIRQPLRYVGLLGPPARRARVFEDAGLAGERGAMGVHGPAGLDIGANTPESIALAIVAQIHAALSGRSGGYMPAEPQPEITRV